MVHLVKTNTVGMGGALTPIISVQTMDGTGARLDVSYELAFEI